MPYSPQPPASIQNVEELRQWVQDELRNVSLAINETQILDLRPSFRAPDRLREGVMVYADGAQFNPGSGEGPYVWDGGAWKYMIAPGATDLTAITSAIAANTANITTLQATSPPGLVFISSQVASNTSQIIFTGLNNTYEAYHFQITRLKPSVHNVVLWMQISVNGGATWKNTNNVWTWLYGNINGGAAAYGWNNVAEGSSAYFRMNGAASNIWGSSAEVMLYPSVSGQNLNMVTWRSTDWYDAGGGTYTVVGNGVESSDSTSCNAVRFVFVSGNIASGRISMYGLRKT